MYIYIYICNNRESEREKERERERERECVCVCACAAARTATVAPFASACFDICVAVLSHRMYLLIRFGTSTPPQNRQLIAYYC